MNKTDAWIKEMVDLLSLIKFTGVMVLKKRTIAS